MKNKLRVLVTRPHPQGEILCEKIQKAGHVAIYFPTIVIEKLPRVNLPEKIEEYDWFIFVSAQAVYATTEWIQKKFLPHRPFTIKIAAIGEGTARALAEYHLPVDGIPTDEWNSEGLLKLPEFQTMVGKKCLIIKGEKGRDKLSQVLSQRGAGVDEAIVYRRHLPKIENQAYNSLFQEEKIDMIVSTSSEGLENLKILLGQEVWSALRLTPITVISDRMKMVAEKLGFTKMIRMKNAGHEAVIELLLKGVNHG